MSFMKIHGFPSLWFLHRSSALQIHSWSLHRLFSINYRTTKNLLLGNSSWPFDDHPDLRGILNQFSTNSYQPVFQLAGMRGIGLCIRQDGRMINSHPSVCFCCSKVLSIWSVGLCAGRQSVASYSSGYNSVWSAGLCAGRQCVAAVNMEHHFAGHPQKEGEVFLKCVRCSKPVCTSNGGCSWENPSVAKCMEYLGGKARRNIPGLGPCRRHVGVGNLHGHEVIHEASKQDEYLLNRMQDMETQVRMVRSENLEFKRVLTLLYSLALTTHSEVKAQNSNVAEKIEHLEETLGLFHPRKTRKSNASSNEMADLNRKMDKLKQFMVHAGSFVDLSAKKIGVDDSEGVVMDNGLQ